MGVNIIPGTKGCVIDAPAESEYAVLPVGELIIIPSALMVVISRYVKDNYWSKRIHDTHIVTVA